MEFPKPKKALGQHWIFDEDVLTAMVEAAKVNKGDDVLEIGPGLGSLTMHLLERDAKVIAVEKDESLIETLKKQQYFKSAIERGVLNFAQEDILQFDLRSLPESYKVVANIPYYLTSNLLRFLLENERSPESITLLVQKEVAERIVAEPGDMSTLAVSVQYYGSPKIIGIVDKELFEPPPEVDSAILHIDVYEEPLFEADVDRLFKVVKAGFAEKRKQLKNSLSGGLRLEKDEATALLKAADIEEKARAQELFLRDWQRLLEEYNQRENSTD